MPAAHLPPTVSVWGERLQMWLEWQNRVYSRKRTLCFISLSSERSCAGSSFITWRDFRDGLWRFTQTAHWGLAGGESFASHRRICIVTEARLTTFKRLCVCGSMNTYLSLFVAFTSLYLEKWASLDMVLQRFWLQGWKCRTVCPLSTLRCLNDYQNNWSWILYRYSFFCNNES